MAELVKVAACQMEPVLFDRARNVERVADMAREAAANGARLVAFPELALTGYIFEGYEEALGESEPVPGPSTELLGKLAGELDVYLAFGLVEEEDGKLFNSSALVGPEGYIGKYQKNHPWWPPEMKWVTAGELGNPVYMTSLGKIGLNICYDLCFPESARCLALNGANVIVHMANWVNIDAGLAIPKFVAAARGYENKVYVVCADRIGTERGVQFAGRSMIVDYWGDVVASASADKQETVYANIDIAATTSKLLVPGEAYSDVWWARRPAQYGVISQTPTYDTVDNRRAKLR